MQIGVIVPQGWTREYEGWEPTEAWARTRDLTAQVEALGFESVWVFDHFHTTPRSTLDITFESFSTLAALASETRRVRLGHIVLCAAYRNPALTAKMISTLDVITGGRMELGIGAGWKRDEWRAYGYGFPDAPERLQILKDQLEVISAMTRSERATYRGTHHSVDDAINVPQPVQKPRIPIMVGGNGPNVTWRLAARYADELNLDGMSPDDVSRAMSKISARCEEIGRDPASLRVSVHVWWESLRTTGQERVDLVGAYARAGMSRVIALIRDSVDSDDALAHWADDARAGGATLEPSTALGS